MRFDRVFLIVLDSLGVGAMPDAALYGDEGTNTIGHLSAAAGGLDIPVLERFGMGNITGIEGVDETDDPLAYWGKAAEASVGKDTMTGHWEIMGVRTTEPMKTFTGSGFPPELLAELEEKTGRRFIGNIAASGTDIIRDLGERHMRTGELILYTSADSVLQIAAHEEIVPLEELYRVCHIAREITLIPAWRVGRVIARPFAGAPGAFARTAGRHDYALAPPEKTVLDHLKESGYEVISIGKINDIYAGHGITRAYPSRSNDEGMAVITDVARQSFTGLAFLNLVDFDMKYGHRRDSAGYAAAIEAFDRQLKSLTDVMSENDLVILTADHGNDPTHTGSDHTREYVPILFYSKGFAGTGGLGTMDTFAVIGATIAENFGVPKPAIGESLAPILQ